MRTYKEIQKHSAKSRGLTSTQDCRSCSTVTRSTVDESHRSRATATRIIAHMALNLVWICEANSRNRRARYTVCPTLACSQRLFLASVLAFFLFCVCCCVFLVAFPPTEALDRIRKAPYYGYVAPLWQGKNTRVRPATARMAWSGHTSWRDHHHRWRLIS